MNEQNKLSPPSYKKGISKIFRITLKQVKKKLKERDKCGHPVSTKVIFDQRLILLTLAFNSTNKKLKEEYYFKAGSIA